jgi:hypothetical protein
LGNKSHQQERRKNPPMERARARSRRFHYSYIMRGKIAFRERGICPLF